jgi:hypothetical protein
VLHGQWPWMWQGTDDTWHALVLTGSGRPGREPDKYVLGPVLFYLLCLTGEESRRWIETQGTSGLTLHVVYREIVKEWTYRFDHRTAETYLTSLVSHFLDPSVAAWLPFNIVTNRKRSVRPHQLRADEMSDPIRMQFTAELADAFAEEADDLVRMAKPPVPADALDRARSRFKIFFDEADA